tara:strand:+ start:5165 stop:6133 length:969 start_codon:yes stop_codon:yes gene_type:complete
LGFFLSIKITKFIHENTTLWDNFINSSNNGTLFHYRAFLDYHENVHFDDYSLLFYQDSKLIAVLPSALVNNSLCSHPGISFGGLIYEYPLSFDIAQNIINALISYAQQLSFEKIQITLPPICYSKTTSDYIEFCLLKSHFQYEGVELSNILTLDSDFNTIYKRYKPAARQAVRKAEKSNVIINQSTNVDDFYKILSNNLSLRHNVSPTHTISELKKLIKLFPDKINLFTAYLDNEMIAGVINFICNENTILAFYISHNNEFQNARPLNMLFTHMFQWAIDKRYKYYDFGLFTVNGEPNLSLARFKESFGTDGLFRKTMVLEL